ncbi:MAG: hypothetical protein LBH96_01700 [Candidatus Peribacteria bacterium]|jgi:tRNA-dihydrouridine synthase|nr:hypothetical protein [Candidatus Peribacteria bacterium]
MEEKLETILRHLDVTVACDQYFEEMIEMSEEEIGGRILIPDGWIEKRVEKNLKNSDFEPHTIVEFRKYLFQYIKGIPESREWKQEMLKVRQYGEVREMIQKFFEEQS